MSYLGRSAKLSLKAQEKVSFLATAGQTVKTGLSYTPSFIEVYVNGVLLTDSTDFTATNGNSVTFTVALLLNDEVTVISLKTFTVADHYSKTEADTLLAAKSPIASPSFTGNVGVGAGTALSPLDVKSGFITVSKDAATAGRIGASAYITGSTANDLIVQATGSGVTKLYQSGVNSLNIDAAGRVTKPLQPSFNAKGSSTLSDIAINTVITVPFATERFDVGSNYSTSTHKFTAPVAGKYLFHVYLRLQNVDASSGYYQVYCVTTNESLEMHIYDSESLDLDPTYWTSTGTTVAHMDANDTAHITLYQAGGQAQTDIHGNSTFCGYLIG